eukprot:TRINITY_DN90210_c0_g1_i1.p1 TRINITY_DN90210_c0_g1~~TRINITY_DN90210_c0_g1_i1.p1  ORF type:complete len:1355 (-),score=292.76 TRINITY_DN90210_c0_g1_i1:155-4219(-)
MKTGLVISFVVVFILNAAVTSALRVTDEDEALRLSGSGLTKGLASKAPHKEKDAWKVDKKDLRLDADKDDVVNKKASKKSGEQRKIKPEKAASLDQLSNYEVEYDYDADSDDPESEGAVGSGIGDDPQTDKAEDSGDPELDAALDLDSNEADASQDDGLQSAANEDVEAESATESDEDAQSKREESEVTPRKGASKKKGKLSTAGTKPAGSGSKKPGSRGKAGKLPPGAIPDQSADDPGVLTPQEKAAVGGPGAKNTASDAESSAPADQLPPGAIPDQSADDPGVLTPGEKAAVGAATASKSKSADKPPYSPVAEAAGRPQPGAKPKQGTGGAAAAGGLPPGAIPDQAAEDPGVLTPEEKASLGGGQLMDAELALANSLDKGDPTAPLSPQERAMAASLGLIGPGAAGGAASQPPRPDDQDMQTLLKNFASQGAARGLSDDPKSAQTQRDCLKDILSDSSIRMTAASQKALYDSDPLLGSNFGGPSPGVAAAQAASDEAMAKNRMMQSEVDRVSRDAVRQARQNAQARKAVPPKRSLSIKTPARKSDVTAQVANELKKQEDELKQQAADEEIKAMKDILANPGAGQLPGAGAGDAADPAGCQPAGSDVDAEALPPGEAAKSIRASRRAARASATAAQMAVDNADLMTDRTIAEMDATLGDLTTEKTTAAANVMNLQARQTLRQVGRKTENMVNSASREMERVTQEAKRQARQTPARQAARVRRQQAAQKALADAMMSKDASRRGNLNLEGSPEGKPGSLGGPGGSGFPRRGNYASGGDPRYGGPQPPDGLAGYPGGGEPRFGAAGAPNPLTPDGRPAMPPSYDGGEFPGSPDPRFGDVRGAPGSADPRYGNYPYDPRFNAGNPTYDDGPSMLPGATDPNAPYPADPRFRGQPAGDPRLAAAANAVAGNYAGAPGLAGPGQPLVRNGAAGALLPPTPGVAPLDVTSAGTVTDSRGAPIPNAGQQTSDHLAGVPGAAQYRPTTGVGGVPAPEAGSAVCKAGNQPVEWSSPTGVLKKLVFSLPKTEAQPGKGIPVKVRCPEGSSAPNAEATFTCNEDGLWTPWDTRICLQQECATTDCFVSCMNTKVVVRWALPAASAKTSQDGAAAAPTNIPLAEERRLEFTLKRTRAKQLTQKVDIDCPVGSLNKQAKVSFTCEPTGTWTYGDTDVCMQTEDLGKTCPATRITARGGPNQKVEMVFDLRRSRAPNGGKMYVSAPCPAGTRNGHVNFTCASDGSWNNPSSYSECFETVQKPVVKTVVQTVVVTATPLPHTTTPLPRTTPTLPHTTKQYVSRPPTTVVVTSAPTVSTTGPAAKALDKAVKSAANRGKRKAARVAAGEDPDGETDEAIADATDEEADK